MYSGNSCFCHVFIRSFVARYVFAGGEWIMGRTSSLRALSRQQSVRNARIFLNKCFSTVEVHTPFITWRIVMELLTVGWSPVIVEYSALKLMSLCLS